MIDNRDADKLICALAKGNMSALERLYTELAPAVYAFARSITKNDESAQDIMQDTFVRVFNSAGKFKPQGYGKAWIMQIARNLSINAVTSRVRTEPEDVLADCPSPGSTEESTETRVMLEWAMKCLTDAEREVITLHAVSGLKLQQIAQVMEEPLGTVKWRHSQAMKKIRTAMAAGEEGAL